MTSTEHNFFSINFGSRIRIHLPRINDIGKNRRDEDHSTQTLYDHAITFTLYFQEKLPLSLKIYALLPNSNTSARNFTLNRR